MQADERKDYGSGFPAFPYVHVSGEHKQGSKGLLAFGSEKGKRMGLQYSSVVERLISNQEVTGSNPVIGSQKPTSIR